MERRVPRNAGSRISFNVYHPALAGLIIIMLYMAFHSILDASRAVQRDRFSMGGIWALWLTGTHFSISAAVGFISLFGVAIMDGLLMISYFNHATVPGPIGAGSHHAGGRKTRPAGDDDGPDGHSRLAAGRHSTKIGAQTQRPLQSWWWGHVHHPIPYTLLDARAVQLLRPP